MLTLYNIAILSEWPGIIWAIYLKQPWLVPAFILFAMFVTFGVTGFPNRWPDRTTETNELRNFTQNFVKK